LYPQSFASRPDYVANSHRELYESIFGDDAGSVTIEQRKILYKEAGEKYVVVRTAAVEAISALPNLETLSWGDGYSLDKTFFETITRCTARHIELDRLAIDDAWSLKPPLTPTAWPLRSLNLDVSMALDKWYEIEGKGKTTTHHLTTFFSTFFHLCSPTLESLSWSYLELIRHDGVPVSIGETAISFPRLRYLRLGFLKLDSVAISSFLAAPLKSLDLPVKILDDPSTLDCEPLRDLEAFTVAHLPREASACKRIAKFIHESKLALGDTAYLDRFIIPTLSSLDFSNLASLFLVWGGAPNAQIPEESLRIGQLASLEQLSPCAGKTFGWRHQWLVDHDKLRHHLSQLKGLTKLALVRDTYPVPLPGSMVRFTN
jgi:hypothetical protein